MDWKIVRGAKISSNLINGERADFKLIHKRILCIVHYEMEKSLSQEEWCQLIPPGFERKPLSSNIIFTSSAKWIII